ncbi:hypothetical protein KOR42_53190 [Thalassoglobus neptunius]|uniref:Right handed beta helix domain-containing protein n=1 Tax=Thalassoglobus neptunius TaxID=1938619 RepID=A0A5C5VAI7_9PLAN|nr:right-handed parallel beta-helix repeat-containing protein [Thalassoglobus neptunius]TWT35010.1 hypothetical protein KOR42_53190 [Thalassoglobus neptunius]
MFRWGVSCVVVCLLAGSSSVFAEEIRVKADDSLAKVVATASSGAVLRIAPGVKVEDFVIRKPIHLIGDGSERVSIGSVLVSADDVTLENLEFGGHAEAVLRIRNTQRVKVDNCRISNTNQEHLGYGMQVRNVSTLDVSDCDIIGNSVGMVALSLTDGTFRGCEVTNRLDGLIFSDSSSNVLVEDCFIHHHLGEGRPGHHADGIQCFRGVKNLTVRGCRLMANMQHMMFESTDGITIDKTTSCGSTGTTITFGWENAKNATLTGNTFAFAGLSLFNMTASGYKLDHNILVSGHSKPALSVKGVEGIQSNHNIFWNSPRAEKPQIAVSEIAFHRNFKEYQQASGMDADSENRDPGFVNAPLAIAPIDPRRYTSARSNWLPLWAHDELFRVGDVIEVNFDGVARECLAIEDKGLRFKPALAKMPSNAPFVVTWGDNEDIQPDLSLRADREDAVLTTPLNNSESSLE